MLLAEALRYQADVRGSTVALVDDERSWTFSELLVDAGALAGRLLEWSASGQRVALLCGNKAEHVIALLAVAATPHEVVVFDPKWSTGELARAIDVFATTLLLLDEDAAPLAEMERLIPCARITGDEATRADIEFRSRAPRDATFVIAPSGGTSGKLKGAKLSHGATVSRFLTQQVEFRIEPTDRFLVCTPLFHGSARSHALSHIYFGGSVRVLSGFDPLSFQAHVQEATATFCVPTMLSRIAELDGVYNPRLALIAGGAAISPELEAVIRERVTPRVYNYYAAVEAGPIAIKRPQDLGTTSVRPGSVGRPVFGATVEILDPDAEGVGIVQVRADFLASGLEGDVDPAVAERLSNEGTYLTGDLGYLGENAQLHLAGRADDVIISGGVNIQPKEVEIAISEALGFASVVALGVPDAEWGERLVAVIAAPEDSRLGYAAAKQILLDKVSRVKIPKEIHWVDEMPLTSMGKINTRELRSRIKSQVNL